jgi:hypothetical protein
MKSRKELSKTYHFIYMDIVAFSDPRIYSDEQVEKIDALNNIVRSSQTYRDSDRNTRLVLPTGDGMVIGFGQSCEQPYNLAVEIQKALAEYNKNEEKKRQIKLRIGIHSGAIFEVIDINGSRNVCGSGVIVARRVMDLGESDHILASDSIAKELKKISCELDRNIHDVGQYKTKHDEFRRIYNIYDETGTMGNPFPPSLDNKIEEIEVTPVISKLEEIGIGPTQQFRQFLNDEAKEEFLAIDDCALLFGTPGFVEFHEEDIKVSLRRDVPALPENLKYIVDKYGELKPHETNRSKCFIHDFHPAILDEGGKWTVELGVSDTKISRALEKALADRDIRSSIGFVFAKDLWNLVVVQILVLSKDGKALFIRRSPYVSYFPNHWSASIDEQMCPLEDGDRDFFDTAVRGIREELGIREASRDWISVVGLAREFGVFNIPVICLAKIPLSAAEIKDRWIAAKDKHEASTIDERQFDLQTMLGIIRSDVYTPADSKVEPYRFHPTARMRILLGLFATFGYDRTVRAINTQM